MARWTYRAALDFTCQICNAVDHAHKIGVLHRDLRPGNMLVSETGMLKVTDFGTSRFLEVAAHGTTVIGSPPYMAPEQFYGKAVFASDVYSVGVTMYQMLTGELRMRRRRRPDLERLIRGELGYGAARQEQQDSEGGERYRAEGAGGRRHAPVSARVGPVDRSPRHAGSRIAEPGCAARCRLASRFAGP
jgi:serine/threonine protein kinase